jgi:hypothetical protein
MLRKLFYILLFGANACLIVALVWGFMLLLPSAPPALIALIVTPICAPAACGSLWLGLYIEEKARLRDYED